MAHIQILGVQQEASWVGAQEWEEISTLPSFPKLLLFLLRVFTVLSTSQITIILFCVINLSF